MEHSLAPPTECDPSPAGDSTSVDGSGQIGASSLEAKAACRLVADMEGFGERHIAEQEEGRLGHLSHCSRIHLDHHVAVGFRIDPVHHTLPGHHIGSDFRIHFAHRTPRGHHIHVGFHTPSGRHALPGYHILAGFHTLVGFRIHAGLRCLPGLVMPT